MNKEFNQKKNESMNSQTFAQINLKFINWSKCQKKHVNEGNVPIYEQYLSRACDWIFDWTRDESLHLKEIIRYHKPIFAEQKNEDIIEK